MHNDARVWNRFAARYFKAPIKDEAAYKRKLELSRRYMHADMAVLELGCGTGGTAELHAPYVRDYVAVDFSEKMLELARERVAGGNASHVRFELAAVEDFDPGEQRFDMVLALSVLHLLEDLDLGLARISNTLKPGGVFISSTACLAKHYGFLRFLAPAGRAIGVLPRVRIFSESDLRQSLEGAGFEIEEDWQPESAKSHVVFIVARLPER